MKIHYYLIAFVLSGSVWAQTPEQTSQDMPAATATTTTTEVMPAATTTEATTTETATTQTESTAATAPAEEQPQTEQAGFSRGSVVRSIFTTGIQEREPVDKIKDTGGMSNTLFYFTELRDMSGQTATHRWEYDGKVVSEIKFNVNGPRWRVWSSKAFTPGWAGEWKVSVLNGAGEIISEDLVNYTAPAEAEAPASAAGAASDEAAQPAEQQFEPPVNPEMIQ